MNRQLFTAIALWLASGPAFAATSDAGGMFFLALIGIVIAIWAYSSAVKNGVEREIARRKAEIESKAQQERALTTKNAEEEAARLKRLEDEASRGRAADVERQRAKLKMLHDEFAQARTAATERQTAELKKQQDELAHARAAFDSSYIAGRRWLAEYIAEAFHATDEATARMLESKKHPAPKSADDVRRIASEKRELTGRLKYLEYVLKTYHEYYPVLEQYSEDVLNESASLALEDDDDPELDRVSRYISKEEYQRLTTAQRNQRALDNWRARKKSSVEIGRIYERYLGYLYEADDWDVTFFGAIAGIEDLGRDLLCIKGPAVHVVQAKYWAKHKTIHEKHIFQLYGTTILLPLTRPDLKNRSITPVFATTTELSETAAWAAKTLKVQVKRADMDSSYPLIKCNVNGRNKIYHLPFDQQYDRVRIIRTKGEGYIETTAEAERLGFRRAMRHTAYAT